MSEGEPTPFGTAYDPKHMRLMLWMVPFAFVLAYILAWVQGAEPWICLLLGAVLAVGVLATAGVYRLRGSAAANDVVWVRVIIGILSALARR
jgi:hypothetical protein